MKTCLIVDDSKVIRMVARRILEGLDFAIAEASDGRKAVEACRARMPDAILLDWTMPVMNGIDFPFKTAVIALVQTAALVGFVVYAASLAPGQRLTRIGLSFVIGGAAGNLIDRLTSGYVLDFFDFYWRGWHFWAFNIADASITIGVALMILDLLMTGRSRVPGTV